MKILYIFTAFLGLVLFSGCASNGGAAAASDAESAPATASSSSSSSSSASSGTAKTAYEGSTGSGLLMERYKSGQIEGFRK